MKNKITPKFDARIFEFLFLFCIFLVSFLIRVIGIRFSEPLFTSGDEVSLVGNVAVMSAKGTLDSRFYAHPDQILFFIHFVLLNLISWIKSGHSFVLSYMRTPYEYFVYARILTVTFGALVPIVAYLIGKEFSKKAAIAAALIFAFFPNYVDFSHYVSPDIPVTLITLLIVLFVIYYLRSENKKWLLLATLFASINTVEKYPGGLSCLLIAYAVIWSQVKKYPRQPSKFVLSSLKVGLAYFGLYFLGVYALAPNLFYNFGSTYISLAVESRSNHLGADGLNWFGNMRYYLSTFLGGSNLIFNLLAILGIYVIVRNKKSSLIPVFYGLVYFLLLSILPLHWERWALPMYTTPLLLAAIGVAYLWDWVGQRKWLTWAISLVFAGSLLYALAYSLSISINLTYKNTILVATEYCENHGITRENSLYEQYTPYSTNYASANFIYRSGKISRDYVIFSSKMYDRFFNEPQRYANIIKLYQSIRKENKLIKQVNPTQPGSSIRFVAWMEDIGYYVQKLSGKDVSIRYTGPTIQIYKVKK